MPTIKGDLLSLADDAWRRLRGRIEGLTDEEYFWEPAPYCWTVRAVGDGTWRADGAALPPDPAPVTTIAWRLTHLADMLGARRNATWIGVSPLPAPDRPGAPGTVADAFEWLDEAYGRFRGQIDAADEEAWLTTMGPIAGPYADSSRLAFILHELDELIHHGAEVGVLRDLYRATRPQDPLVAAALGGDLPAVESQVAADPGLRDAYPDLVSRAAAAGQWEVVRSLAEHGFDVNETDGTPAAHYAAGAGELDAVRTLVGRGADLTVADPRFDLTPLGWARHFRRREVARYLAAQE